MSTLRLLVRDFVDDVLGKVDSPDYEDPKLGFSESERLAFELAWEDKLREALKAEMLDGYTYDVRMVNAGIVDLTGGSAATTSETTTSTFSRTEHDRLPRLPR